MNQIEFLLRLSENAQEEGETLARKQNAEREEFVKQLLDLERMVDLARQNIHAELGRWGIHPAKPVQQQPLKNPGEPMPRIVQKGPAVGNAG